MGIDGGSARPSRAANENAMPIVGSRDLLENTVSDEQKAEQKEEVKTESENTALSEDLKVDIAGSRVVVRGIARAVADSDPDIFLPERDLRIDLRPLILAALNIGRLDGTPHRRRIAVS